MLKFKSHSPWGSPLRFWGVRSMRKSCFFITTPLINQNDDLKGGFVSSRLPRSRLARSRLRSFFCFRPFSALHTPHTMAASLPFDVAAERRISATTPCAIGIVVRVLLLSTKLDPTKCVPPHVLKNKACNWLLYLDHKWQALSSR